MCETVEQAMRISDDHKGWKISVNEFPELNITVLHSENHLCPSNYTNVICFWEGDLSLTLDVNGTEITLNDHDSRKDKTSVIQTTEYEYKFQGTHPRVKNRSREETYLVFTIERCLKQKVPTYNLRQPFTVDLAENPTTGFAWEVEVTPGLEIVSSTYSNKCQEGIQGCGGIRTWVLRGIQKGEQKFTGRYRRPWENEPVTPKVLTFRIV